MPLRPPSPALAQAPQRGRRAEHPKAAGSGDEGQQRHAAGNGTGPRTRTLPKWQIRAPGGLKRRRRQPDRPEWRRLAATQDTSRPGARRLRNGGIARSTRNPKEAATKGTNSSPLGMAQGNGRASKSSSGTSTRPSQTADDGGRAASCFSRHAPSGTARGLPPRARKPRIRIHQCRICAQPTKRTPAASDWRLVQQARREEKEGKEKGKILKGKGRPRPPSSRTSGLPPASSGGGESEGRSEGALGRGRRRRPGCP
ncbi:hypothetical protein GQ55_7G099400 [Panicum hallii var. hallii]|uniref:Uncharacterized protein n=1 Tax=Panicum hallii var. hallii TaxID=1504633 RepID=A0A2T7CTJ8_9POAL|nr:hypothetical protein GQ55_7G099400 [Panicum hallii var. hallii]